MADRTIRWDVIDATLSALRLNPRLDGVQIEYGYPGRDLLEQEYIYAAADAGPVDIPVMTGLPAMTGMLVERDDEFTVTFAVGVLKPGGTLAEAKQRCEEIVGAFEYTLAKLPTLADLDGLLTAKLTNKSGHTNQLDDGAWSATAIELSAHGRYGGTVDE